MEIFIIVILIAVVVFLLWIIKNLSDNLKNKKNQVSRIGTNEKETKLNDEIKRLNQKIKQLEKTENNEKSLNTEISRLREQLKNKNLSFNKNVEGMKSEIENLKSEKQNLAEQINRKSLKIEELEKRVSEKKESQSNSDFEKIFNNFQKISESEKNRIEAVITDKKGKEVFLGLGLQASNLKLLWEQIEFNIQRNENLKDTNILIETYYYFFELYNLLFSTPVYTFLEEETGKKYNPITTIPVNTGYTKNEVKETVFKGYKNRKGDIVKKSLVILD